MGARVIGAARMTALENGRVERIALHLAHHDGLEATRVRVAEPARVDVHARVEHEAELRANDARVG